MVEERFEPFVQLVSQVGLVFSEDVEGEVPGKERSRGENLGIPTAGDGGAVAALLATTLLFPPFGESNSPPPSPTESSMPSISCFHRWSSPFNRSSSSAAFARLALRSRWARGAAPELRLTLLRRLCPLVVVLRDGESGEVRGSLGFGRRRGELMVMSIEAVRGGGETMARESTLLVGETLA